MGLDGAPPGEVDPWQSQSSNVCLYAVNAGGQFNLLQVAWTDL